MPVHGKIPVVAIFGPTAVGKSAVAVEVASVAGAEIISADSMQVYEGLSIITDQPSAALLERVPHHMIATIPASAEYSAAAFSKDAAVAIENIACRARIPLLAGGTGLYVRGLLGGFSYAGRSSDSAGRMWQELIREQGMEKSFQELKRLDPAASEVIDRHNPRRLARALEAAASGGPSVSYERGRLWSPDSPFRVLSFALDMQRDELYRKIEARVDDMLKSGAIEEVSEALQRGVSRTASQAIGFTEIQNFLQNRCNLEDTAEAIKAKSRRYAKRQLTWMRKMPDIVKIDVAGGSSLQTVEQILNHMRRAGLISS